MKRFGNLFTSVTTFDNLLFAAEKTACGRRQTPAVARMLFNLESIVFDLQARLRDGTYVPKPHLVFWIRDPKPRRICAAQVEDRIVHHAICHVLEPIFERWMIFDTYACRKGKGTHAAIQRTQQFARQFPYVMQCDIRKYFDSVNHTILKTLLRRILKDPQVVTLLDQIIDAVPPEYPSGVGIPIGNLTSQHFANLYLGELDHFVKDQLGIKGYVRYMDDFLIFGNQKTILFETYLAVRTFLDERLRLELKIKTAQVFPVTEGIPFLGFRVFPGTVRLQRSGWNRFRHRIARREAEFTAFAIDETRLLQSVASLVGHLRHANTLRARQHFFSMRKVGNRPKQARTG